MKCGYRRSICPKQPSDQTNHHLTVLFENKADNYGIENRKQNRFSPSVVSNKALLLFCSKACPNSEKTRLSHTTLDCSHESSPHRAQNHDQTWRADAPLNVDSSLPSLRAVGGLCPEISVGTWGADQFCIKFLRHRTGGHFRSKKKIWK